MIGDLEYLGADRVIEPKGALPQGAWKIDGGPPLRKHELQIEVEALCLDSTSFRQLSEENGGDPEAIAEAIAAIVDERGKMHNPVTGSGGVLIGKVLAAGSDLVDPPAEGQRVVTLASLSLTPLNLSSVGPVDPGSPQVPVQGEAFLMGAAPWAECPEDIDLPTALAALDVCGAASQTDALAKEGDTVFVLGAGHAGKIAAAAAKHSIGEEGKLVVVDADPAACQAIEQLGFADSVIEADLRDSIGTLEKITDAGYGRADLTIVVVNATGCEATSILLTDDEGTVLFFSMATSFTAAALGSEGVSSQARMLVGSGYAPDRGRYALDLLRRHPELRSSLSPNHEEAGR